MVAKTALPRHNRTVPIAIEQRFQKALFPRRQGSMQLEVNAVVLDVEEATGKPRLVSIQGIVLEARIDPFPINIRNGNGRHAIHVRVEMRIGLICANNPLSRIDPSGNSWLDVFTGGLSAIVGAFSSTVRNWGHQLDHWMAAHPIVGQVIIAVAVVVVSVVTYGCLTPALTPFWAAVCAGAAGGLTEGTMIGEANNEGILKTMELGAEDMAIGAAEAEKRGRCLNIDIVNVA